MILIPVNTIEVKEDGSGEINLASTASNDDWLKSARLLRANTKKSKKKLKKLEDDQMAYIMET